MPLGNQENRQVVHNIYTHWGRPVSTETVGFKQRAEAPLASIKAAKNVTANNNYAYAA